MKGMKVTQTVTLGVTGEGGAVVVHSLTLGVLLVVLHQAACHTLPVDGRTLHRTRARAAIVVIEAAAARSAGVPHLPRPSRRDLQRPSKFRLHLHPQRHVEVLHLKSTPISKIKGQAVAQTETSRRCSSKEMLVVSLVVKQNAPLIKIVMPLSMDGGAASGAP